MKSTTRILVITGQLGMGGAERQIYHLLNGIDRHKFEFRVANLSDGGGDYWNARLQQLGVSVIRVQESQRVQRIWTLRRLAKEWDAAIVYSMNFYVNGYAAVIARTDKVAALGSLRNMPNIEHVGRLPLFWRLLSVYGVDHLVCNSRIAADALCRQYPRLTHIQVIPNGVETPDQGVIEHWCKEGAAEIDKRAGELVVGFVGYLGPQKNVRLLLRAFERIATEFQNARLVIVGDGPLRSELEDLATQLDIAGRVHFLGRRPLAEQLMPAFDLLCLTSDYEGMPNVLLEAGSVGLPVVASQVAGTAEVVLHGETGLLYPPGDLEAFTACLRTVLRDPQLRQRLGAAARQRMLNEYSVPRLAQRYAALFDRIVIPKP